MEKQEMRGKDEKLLGQGKEIVGILTGDTALELEGDRQQAEGATHEKLEKAHRRVQEFIDGVAGAIRKWDGQPPARREVRSRGRRERNLP
jgi:uncharacterized protein YjbJ (UPF0337 family)